MKTKHISKLFMIGVVLLGIGLLSNAAQAETIIPSDSLTPDNFDTYWDWNYPWGDTHNGSAQMYVDQVTLDANGTATIVAVTPNPYPKGLEYASGAFHSKAQILVNDQNPEWDIKGEFKAPTVRGAWPAFWPTGAWNWPPEIDILEFKGDNYNWFNTFDGRWETAKVRITDAAFAWHEYRCHLTKINDKDVKVEFYLDGSLVGTHTGSNFVGEPFDVIVNMQMEGSSGSPGPTGSTYYYARNIVITRNEASGPSDGWQKVDDTNANITYDSNWGIWEGNPGYISTEHFCETVGAEATFTFTGNQARYYGFKRNDLGWADILVDDVLVTTLDLYSSSSLYDYLLYETEILPWGEHTITVRVNGSQNSSSSGYEIIIDAFSSIDNGEATTAPTANFTYSTSDMTVDFTDGSTDSNGSITSWAWNFGDEATSENQNPSHTYTVDDTYTVTLTVTDNDNETNSTSRSVTVTEQQTGTDATLGLDKSVYASTNSIIATYANGPGNAKDWIGIYSAGSAFSGSALQWQYTSGTDGTRTFNPLPDGDYEAYFLENDGYNILAGPVVFSVGDGGGGGGSAPNPNPMTWLVEPYMNDTWPNDNVGTMTASTATDTDGGIEYFFDCVEAPEGGNWNGGEDSGWLISNTFSNWYLLDGYTYTYRVKARNALKNETGWSATAAISVGSVNTPPIAGFSSTTSDLTANFLDLSSDSDGDIVWWEWDFGDGNTSDDQNPIQIHTYAATGTYYVTLTVTDDDDATDSVTLPVTVTAPSLPPVPAAPTDLLVWAVAKTRIDLSWFYNADNETGFKIERSKRTNRSFVEIATFGPNENLDDDVVTFYSDRTVRKGTTYHYRVRATNADGDSAYSNEASARTPKKL